MVIRTLECDKNYVNELPEQPRLHVVNSPLPLEQVQGHSHSAVYRRDVPGVLSPRRELTKTSDVAASYLGRTRPPAYLSHKHPG